MLKTGYSIVAVSLFWAIYFGIKVVIALPLAQIIAHIGAKKGIMISNFLYMPSMIAFMFLSQFGLMALVVVAIFQSTSAALYNMSYNINFSRVKSSENAGRQVAVMNIAEKIAKGVTPLIGGLIAMYFDPRISIGVSAVFFAFAGWPLMRSGDSMTTGFSLAPKGFPWHKVRSSLVAQVPVGFNTYASDSAWSIFLVSLIFTASGDKVYAELGALTSLILLVSLASTHMYGKLIDRKAGGQLLVWAGLANVFVNIFRALVRTPVAAVGVNAVNEVTTTGYSMAMARGVFDDADRSKYRVFYIGMVEVMANAGATAAALALALVISLLRVEHGFMAFYLLTAVVVSLIMLTKFKIYAKA